MNINIRNLKKEDFETVKSWWNASNLMCPPMDCMPEESHFILEIDNKPVASVGAYLTNGPQAFLENFVCSPELEKGLRKEYTTMIYNHLVKYVKEKGYKYVVGYTNIEKLVSRYEDLGLKRVLSNTVIFGQEI